MELALCLFCFALALNVYSVYYNYFDFRYNWSALEISYFFSAFGVLLALTSGMGIRFLVPKRLTEGQGILLGWSLQVRVMRTHVCLLGASMSPSDVLHRGVTSSCFRLECRARQL